MKVAAAHGERRRDVAVVIVTKLDRLARAFTSSSPLPARSRHSVLIWSLPTRP